MTVERIGHVGNSQIGQVSDSYGAAMNARIKKESENASTLRQRRRYYRTELLNRVAGGR
jgi:cephalosporin-C deacetylase-like acetyl esterase